LPSKGPKRLRVEERLANSMYDASDPGSTPWLRQGWTVRHAWLMRARERLEGADSFTRRPGLWRDVWGRIKLRRV
jgi:hypothetical protein